MSKNLTKVVNHPYHKREVAVYERDDEKWGKHLITRCPGESKEYLTGPVIDRLHEFEELGLEPDQLEEIVRRYRAYVHSQYGVTNWPKENPYLPCMIKIDDGDDLKKIEELGDCVARGLRAGAHVYDEWAGVKFDEKIVLNALADRGPHHVFIGGIHDVAHLYPRMMVLARGNGKTYTMAKIIEELIKEKTMSRTPIRSGRYPWGSEPSTNRAFPKIEDVRFNDPATIVFWADGTKTVVKAQPGETYDPEKGLAMAISKKALGNNHDYYIPFKKYLKKYYKNKKEDVE